MRFLKFIIFFLLLAAVSPAFSQTEPKVVRVDSSVSKPAAKAGVFKDSTRLALERLPRESARRSFMVPGLGQIHNKQYWKLPFVYGGYVTLGLVYNFQQHNYRKFLHELQYQLVNDKEKSDPDLVDYSFANLISAKDYHRRNRDLTLLGFAIWHTFQTLDALVAAKMFRYDVSPDVVLKWNLVCSKARWPRRYPCRD